MSTGCCLTRRAPLARPRSCALDSRNPRLKRASVSSHAAAAAAAAAAASSSRSIEVSKADDALSAALQSGDAAAADSARAMIGALSSPSHHLVW
jgi:hypothetical protein